MWRKFPRQRPAQPIGSVEAGTQLGGDGAGADKAPGAAKCGVQPPWGFARQRLVALCRPRAWADLGGDDENGYGMGVVGARGRGVHPNTAAARKGKRKGR